MDMRDWLSIIILVGIVAILVDGYRRRSRARSPIRMKIDKNVPPPGPEDELTPELPTGKARVRPRGNRQPEGDESFYQGVHYGTPAGQDTGPVDPLDDHAAEAWDDEDDDIASADYPDEDDDAVTVPADEFMDEFDDEDEELDDENDGLHDEDEEFYDEDEELDDEEFDDDNGEQDEDAPLDSDDGRIEPSFGSMDEEDEMPMMADVDDAPARARQPEKPVRGRPARKIPSQVFQAELPLDDDLDDEDGFDDSDGDDDEENRLVEEFIVINVMSRPGSTFLGSEMLPVLKHHGLRLGNMNIFHRHGDARGSGPVMFSMANMVKPGTFDMATMDTFTSPGVSLFMRMPSQIGHMQCFDAMLEAANALKDALDGELKDEQRSVLTRQTIEHYRQRIRDFELRMLSRK